MRNALKALAATVADTRIVRGVVEHLVYPEVLRSIKWEVQPDEPSPSGLVETLAWKVHSYLVLNEELAMTGEDCSRDGLRSDKVTRGRILDIVVQEVAAVEGDILEFGVSAGESLLEFGERCPDRRVVGFDSFEGLPEAWWSRPQGAFKAAPPQIERSNVTLVQGLFDESVPRFLSSWDGSAGIVHVDCDLYSSTMSCLEPIAHRLQRGTVVLFDEYYNYPDFAKHEWKAWRQIRARFGIVATCIAYDGRRAAFRVDTPAAEAGTTVRRRGA
jgi:hypothetical protein